MCGENETAHAVQGQPECQKSLKAPNNVKFGDMCGEFDIQQMASQSHLWGRVPGGGSSPLGAVELFRQHYFPCSAREVMRTVD